jgi:hypothetical protein
MFQLLVSVFVASGVTLLLITLLKHKDLTASKMAESYCACMQKNDSIKGQKKYMICNRELEKKNKLYKLYMDKANSDTLISYNLEKQRQIDNFMADFLKQVDKNCLEK